METKTQISIKNSYLPSLSSNSIEESAPEELSKISEWILLILNNLPLINPDRCSGENKTFYSTVTYIPKLKLYVCFDGVSQRVYFIAQNKFCLPSNSNESIQEVVFSVSELAVLILNNVPWEELDKCMQVNKTFYSIVNAKFSLPIFLERAKRRIDSIETNFIREEVISRIAQVQTLLSIKEANMTLKKMNDKRNAVAALIEIVKKALENGSLEVATKAAEEILYPYDKFKAWLMILNYKKTDKNLEKCVARAIKEIEIHSVENSAIAYLQLWNVVKNEYYFSKASTLIEKVGPFESFKFWFEFSKMDPSPENKQKAKKQITLFSDTPPTLKEREVLEHFNAAIDFAKTHDDKAFMGEIKAKIETIEKPAIKLEIWRSICQAEPEVENNFEKAINLIEHAPDEMSQAKIWLQFFEITKKPEYLNKASNLVDLVASQHHVSTYKIDSIKSTFLKIIRTKSDHNLIDEAKIDTAKIKYDTYLKALAWIAIWKNEKTNENLKKAVSLIILNPTRLQIDLWIEMAQASQNQAIFSKADSNDNLQIKFDRLRPVSSSGLQSISILQYLQEGIL